jgi:hypothetical protein
MKLQEAADVAHLHLALEGDDGGDLETGDDDDDPERHRRLAPCTDIGCTGEQGDD